MRTLGLAAMLLLLAVTTPAQSPWNTPRELSASSTRLLDVPAFAPIGAARCDNAGNLFFRMAPGISEKGSYVLEINPSSQNPTVYPLPEALSANTATFEFYVMHSGQVWELDENLPDGRIYLVGFGADGAVTSQTHLQTPPNLEIRYFAVSNTGEALVSGFLNLAATESSRSMTFVGLLTESGTLIKELPELSGQQALIAKSVYDLPQDAVTADPNGNFWYARSGQLFMITPSGDIARRFSFAKPDSHAGIASLTLSNDLLLIHFFEAGPKPPAAISRFLVLNAETGKTVAAYVPSADIGNASPVCLNSSGYTFMRFKDKKMQLLSASTQ